MLLAAGLLLACQCLFFVGVGLLLRLWLQRKLERLTTSAQEELFKLIEGKECVSGSILNAVGRTIGTEAGRSAKASLMANLSNMSRDANLDAADAQAQALGGQSPALGAILGKLGPRSRKNALTNPIAQLAINGLLGALNKPGAAQPGNGSSEYTGRRHKD